MEKETRMSRYKALRERVRSEMEIEYSVSNDDNIDDDFLGFINKKEDNNENSEDEYVSGKYDTKMEILNIVKKYNKEPETKPSLKDKFQQLTHKKDKEKKLTFLEKLAKLSTKEDVEKLNEFVEQEKTEKMTENEENQKPEVSKEEMDSSLLDFVSLLKKEEIKEAVKEEKIEEKKTDNEINEDYEESKLGVIIDYIIVGLIFLLVVFLLLIIKQLF